MKNLVKFLLLILIGLILRISNSRAQDANWSVDIIGGSPYMLSNVKSSNSPFGGFGLRYSINPLFSAQFQLNGGVLAGNSDVTGSYFSNNFLQYSFRGIFNVTGLFNKPKALSKFNLYLYAGAGHLKAYKRQSADNQTKISNYNSFFYVSNTGLNIRYYLNEHIDFLAGSEMNFSQTHILDNNDGANYDNYLMNYVGVSFKILSNKRQRQNLDWVGIKLPYVEYDEALKIAENKTAEAEAKSLQAVKDAEAAKTEAELAKAEANAKLAKAEAASLDMMKEMNTVQFKLDTLKDLMLLINQNNTGNNNISVPRINTTPSNNKVQPVQNNSIGSFASYTDNIVTPIMTVSYEEPSVKLKSSVKGPNMEANHSTEVVKAIDNNQKFAIVLGSYVKPENAFNAKKALSEKGYKVDVVHFNDPKVQRIIIYSESLEDAQTRLAEMREKENAEAWLLTIQ